MANTSPTGVIAHFEGFSPTAYWDRNAWRVGYGSDTVTNPDGTVIRVTPSTTTTPTLAQSNLSGRTLQSQQSVINSIGQTAWDNLTPEAQAAATSVAYNYGSLSGLPTLVRALQSGDPAAISQAIAARSVDNGGINSARRTAEAALVAGHPIPPSNIPNATASANTSQKIPQLGAASSINDLYNQHTVPVPLAPLPTTTPQDLGTSLAFNPVTAPNATPDLSSSNASYPMMGALYPQGMTADSGAIPLSSLVEPNSSGSPDDRSSTALYNALSQAATGNTVPPSYSQAATGNTIPSTTPPGYNQLTPEQRNAIAVVPPTASAGGLDPALKQWLNATPAQPTGQTIPDPGAGPNVPYTVSHLGTPTMQSTIVNGVIANSLNGLPDSTYQGAANGLSGIANWLAPLANPSSAASTQPTPVATTPPGYNTVTEAQRNALLAVPSTNFGASMSPDDAASFYSSLGIGASHPNTASDYQSGVVPTTSGISGTVQLPAGVTPQIPSLSGSGGGSSNNSDSWSQLVNSFSAPPSSASSSSGGSSGYAGYIPGGMGSSAPSSLSSMSPSDLADYGYTPSTSMAAPGSSAPTYVQQLNPAYTAWMNNQATVAAPSPFSNPGVQGLSPDDRDSPTGIAMAVPGLTSAAFAPPPAPPAPPKFITVAVPAKTSSLAHTLQSTGMSPSNAAALVSGPVPVASTNGYVYTPDGNGGYTQTGVSQQYANMTPSQQYAAIAAPALRSQPSGGYQAAGGNSTGNSGGQDRSGGSIAGGM